MIPAPLQEAPAEKAEQKTAGKSEPETSAFGPRVGGRFAGGGAMDPPPPSGNPFQPRGFILQRKCGPGKSCDEGKKEDVLQRSAAPGAAASMAAPSIVHGVLNTPGKPLDRETRAFMEPRFGHDLSRVRLHADAQAAESARAVNALAYAVGNHVVFGQGKYEPHSLKGRKLLAHELAHTLQQRGGASGVGNLRVGEAGSGEERRADDAAERVLAGGRVAGLARMTGPLIQRQPSQRTQILANLRGAIAGGNWPDAAYYLGGLSPDDINMVLRGLNIHQIASLSDGAAHRAGVGRGSSAYTMTRPRVEAEYDRIVNQIRALPVYPTLPAGDRAVADDIMTRARPTDNCLYYIENLLGLFQTPTQPPSVTAAASRSQAVTAVQAERNRLATPQGAAHRLDQENAAGDPSRVWAVRPGQGGVTFRADNRDPNNIVVQLKVHLTPASGATATDVSNVEELEDVIERFAATHGYTVDLVFVHAPGPDVFEVLVDPHHDVDSGHFRADDPRSIAHEIHHLMGLEDRYNYIHDHARDRQMAMGSRLHWFQVQLNRDLTRGPDPNAGGSIMHSLGNPPLNDDVCRVAGLNQASCTAARAGAGP